MIAIKSTKERLREALGNNSILREGGYLQQEDRSRPESCDQLPTANTNLLSLRLIVTLSEHDDGKGISTVRGGQNKVI